VEAFSVTSKKHSARAIREKSDQKHATVGSASAAKDGSHSGAVIDGRSGKERRAGDRRKHDIPVAVERRQIERRVKVNRRRQIDPTTCERDYSPDEIEFMAALDAYKRRSGRMFPTCSEVLEVIRGLGYEKRVVAPAVAAGEPMVVPVAAETAV
jgi:hypothetical protein